MRRRSLKVLFAAAEAYPFAKAGGLGDVGGALPRALAARGHQVRLILPHYPSVGPGDPSCSVAVPLGPSTERVRFLRHGTYRGVEVYSVANGDHFERDHIYGYPDDDARFILFSKAVAAYPGTSGWVPDIVHVNDWHLGLVPQALRRSRFPRTRVVHTLHNLGLQGPGGGSHRDLIGPGDRFTGTLLARGIRHADRVNTVSGRYLEEILTPEKGMGLDRLLRSRGGDVTAILNGIDGQEFDPAQDPWIEARYDHRSLHRKAANTADLRRRSGLVADPGAPVAGMVARLVGQKGLDPVLESLEDLVMAGLQVVVAGVGEPRYRRALRRATVRFRGRVAYHATGEEMMARRVYAGADLFLAPSSYEPCGLAPLIALRYGAIPVVRHTGGLAETIPDVAADPRGGLGFAFRGGEAGHLVAAVRRAVAVRRDPRRWEALQRRAMAASFSWPDAARAYEGLYLGALREPPRPRG
ncbi:MAG: glycogen synthase [Actinomycetota bacterium]